MRKCASLVQSCMDARTAPGALYLAVHPASAHPEAVANTIALHPNYTAAAALPRGFPAAQPVSVTQLSHKRHRRVTVGP
jgi:hypothetical protein